MDEAAAKLNIQLSSKPQVLDDLDRKIVQLQMEKMSLESDEKLRSEDSSNSGGGTRSSVSAEHRGRIAEIEEQLATLGREQQGLRERWDLERGAVSRVQDLKNSIAATVTQLEQAERQSDLTKAGQLKYVYHLTMFICPDRVFSCQLLNCQSVILSFCPPDD